jgi:Flp pilus assembly protein TadD
MNLHELKVEAQKALRSGAYDHALTFMDKALAIRPDEPRLTNAYARALLANGDLDPPRLGR